MAGVGLDLRQKPPHPLSAFPDAQVFIPVNLHQHFFLGELRKAFFQDDLKQEKSHHHQQQEPCYAGVFVFEQEGESLIIETVNRNNGFHRFFTLLCFGGLFITVHHEINNRQQGDGHHERDQQGGGHRDGLVGKQRPGDAADKYKGDKHAGSGQGRAEQGPDYLVGCQHAGIRELIPSFPVLRDVVDYDDGIVNHHAYPENETREGNDVDGDIEKPQEHDGDDDRYRHSDDHEGRQSQVAKKQEDDDKSQDRPYEQGGFQVADGVIQQGRLVLGYLEAYARVGIGKAVYFPFEAFLERLHFGIRLFDDGHGDGLPLARQENPLLLLGGYLYGGDIAELQQPAFVPGGQVHVFDFIDGIQPRGEIDVVLVVSFVDQDIANADVVVVKCFFNDFIADAQGS